LSIIALARIPFAASNVLHQEVQTASWCRPTISSPLSSARQSFKRFLNSKKSGQSFVYHNYHFGGKGKKEEPVVNAPNAVVILVYGNSKVDCAIKRECKSWVLKVIGGDESLIETILANALRSQEKSTFAAIASTTSCLPTTWRRCISAAIHARMRSS
jgi:hypothetical protein